MPKYVTIDAPSVLGLGPTGIERLPEALRAAGLLEGLAAQEAGRVVPPPYDPRRDPKTRLLNPEGIRDYSLRLADGVGGVLGGGGFPLVLGGDCSILIGCMLALRRLGRHGLFFVDGHSDFYLPEQSKTGEAADCDLALVSGRGPDLLTDIDGMKPLVRDEDVVVFGYRDAAQAASDGSRDVKDTRMGVFDLGRVRELGVGRAAETAVGALLRDGPSGFWVHLDADVLDDGIMPAVDYRMPDGLSFEELSGLLKVLLGTGRTVGMSLTIFNPALDEDGRIAHGFASAINAGLATGLTAGRATP
jgi:arginase